MFVYMVMVIYFAASIMAAEFSDDLPDVIIGDPIDASSDVVGPAISEAEFEAALANNDLLTYQSEEGSPLESQNSFFQGDIQIKSKDKLVEIMLNKETDGQSSAISNPSLKWPSAQIPYFISSHFSSQERAVIARAMAEYHQQTCIRFIPRSTHRNYIHILRASGCSSMVGRVGGAQTVSLGNGCVRYGTVIHELMHATGFWHEQSRYDRDSYVTINWSNIWAGMAYNFNTKTRSVTQDLGLPYDYSSVMHYGQYAFARNPRVPTIYPKQHGAQILGTNIGFSKTDIMGLNLLYQCSGKPNPKPSGCTDTNTHCSDWAGKGQCNANSAYMHVYCKKSCDKCDTTVKPEPPKPSSCVDKNRYCQDWAAKGQCDINAEYMKVDCKKSCNMCGTIKPTNCVDNNKFCADWASKGQCQMNPEYMKVGCPKSCNTCGTIIVPDKCVDTNSFCPDWSKRGYCQSNPTYMHDSCRKSCNKCSTTITTDSITTKTLTTTPKTTATVTPTTKTTEKSTKASSEVTEDIPITTINPTETSTNEPCEDNNEFCSDWASIGHCLSNSEFMNVMCKNSCDRCSIPKPTGDCIDDDEFCPFWATKGYCESNHSSSEFMKKSCRKTCDICEEFTEAPTEINTVTDSPNNETISITTFYSTAKSTIEMSKASVKPAENPESCEDDNEFCSDWESLGHCESNYGFMHVKCKKSCDLCNIPMSPGNSLDDNLPQVALSDTLIDASSDVPGPPVTDAELEASLLDASLLEPPPEDSPISTQSQYFQGDILLQSQDELFEILLNNETSVQNDAIANPDRKWPKALIPYIISSSFSAKERAVIVRAFAEFKKKTCIRMTPKKTHSDYVHIIKGSGCSSSIGRVRGGQTLSLGDGCVYFGIVIHELMHAAGFWHEQSRIDRDNHVTINWNNIIRDLKYNFEKKTRSVSKDLGLPYDFASVMHYSQYAFAINPQVPTIVAKKSGQKILGQRKGFSELDVRGLKLLYECGGEPIPKPTGCTDTNVFCSDWARKGECAKNTEYMHSYCKKSCNKCGTTTTTGPSQEVIPISNIVEHSGFRPGGAGPENLLKIDGYWNPNPKPWFVVFDLGKSHVVTSFQATNFGDTTHDMTGFKLEASEDLESWTRVKTVDNVETGTGKNQIFRVSGTGRFWRFTVTATAEGFQPYLKMVAFFGFPIRSSLIPLSASSIVDHGGFGPGGSGPEKLLTNEGFWNPNPAPWFVVLNLQNDYTITSIKLSNFGDTVHDVTAFTLEISDDLETWHKSANVINMETGIETPQVFRARGLGRFVRFTVTETAQGYQPYLQRLSLFGYTNSL